MLTRFIACEWSLCSGEGVVIEGIVGAGWEERGDFGLRLNSVSSTGAAPAIEK